jgi:hypothetical protein
MDIQEIRETPIWQLYEKGRNYHRMTGIYTDTDRNYRMYNGDQWAGAKLGDVEPVQKNFIKPIVKYKLSVIHSNLYAINYSSQNYESQEFQRQAKKYCDMLNGYAWRVWERGRLDYLGRRVTKDAAINDEGIIYVDFDPEKMMPVNEIVKKNDIYYGNENDDDIQAQPYILIRKRLPVANAVELAISLGMSESKVEDVCRGDNDTFEESGEAAKQEVDDMVTVVYKLYRLNGTVHFSVATRWAMISEDNDTGLTLYPVAHFVWEEKEGSSRGEGEVRFLTPSQIEVNRTEVRRILTVKQMSYPQKVADKTKIQNPASLNTVGGTIWTNGAPVEDVHKIVGILPPAQMSPDVKALQDDMIQITRDLAGAGDTAAGQVDPESASGRAILAVQTASQAPMTEQREAYKAFIEDLGRIWLEYLIVHAVDGVQLEDRVTDPATGEEVVQVVNVPQSVLQELQATVKIDITPKSVYDRFAQEQTIENLFLNGLFTPQRVSELEIYYKILPDDSVAPKMAIGEAIEYIKQEQRKIAMIQAQAQLMQQRAQQFLMEDVDGQASQIADARTQLEQAGQAEAEPETGNPADDVAQAEQAIDDKLS